MGSDDRALLMASLCSLLVWHAAGTDGYNVSALYSGVLSLLSIFCGFLATFYVFVATRSNAFLEAIRKTHSFSQLLDLIRFTIQWTIFALAVTLYLMVSEPKSFALWGAVYFGVLIWCWIVSLIVVNFLRITQMFFSIVKVG